MNLAYVDTSCLVATAFGERGAKRLRQRLLTFDELVSSNLLEAELRSAFHREDVAFAPEMLSWIAWVLPDRPLGREMSRVLEVGRLRGADLWHLACALYLVDEPGEATFLTLDARQRRVASGLGFGV
ncbi:MAG: PIN domain-containing protein [Gemmatimonadota bacterium]|nr:PIN domain-containing protein [Gemmatimonadota bacterium]